MLILSVAPKGDPDKVRDVTVIIDAATKVTVLSGGGKKELTGKETFTNPHVKEGARATAVFDAGGKTLEVRIEDRPKGR
jgi:hypothetical protein